MTMNGISLIEDVGGVTVRIPMQMKKRGGRKEIIVPDSLGQLVPQQPDYQEAFVIALARAHRWQKLLDSGRYSSINQMATALGTCDSYMRLFILLAPDIIEAIIDGKEPDGFSQNKLVGVIPADWNEQRKKWGFAKVD